MKILIATEVLEKLEKTRTYKVQGEESKNLGKISSRIAS